MPTHFECIDKLLKGCRIIFVSSLALIGPAVSEMFEHCGQRIMGILESKVSLMARVGKNEWIHKNVADVDIVTASGKTIQNVKYRSRALGQCVRLKGMSRTITVKV